ncbi:MAG: leucyl aminopeptidase [Gemmatimonadetes bacterium]|nr:leucyl aminopeptidase [Gemmatimonadota bacterium]
MSLEFTLSHAAPAVVETPLLAVILPQDPAMDSWLQPLDTSLHGALARTLARRDFRGGRDETLLLVGGDTGIQRLLLVGRGAGPMTRTAIRRASAVAARQAVRLGTGALAVCAPDITAEAAEGVCTGAAAGAWSYPDLQTPPAEKDRRQPLSRVSAVLPDHETMRAAFAAGVAVAHGQALAKRLGMMPGNVCTPDTFADVGRDLAARHGMTCTVLGRDEMAALGMGSFLSVAQGTPEEPRLVRLDYRGGAPDAPPVVLVGKGLCFDTGGISLKPAADMEWMKYDMSGAGGVLGAMEALGRLRLPLNVTGLIGATTNMPSGTAVKPGDVVRASNGKTIEIINTDAEGRLVLADLLVYAAQMAPALVVDAATLTGAIVIGLGHHAVGVFGSDDAATSEVLAAGTRAGEPGWALPLWDEYKEQIKSDVADLRNTGGRSAGSITAAMFLREFAAGYPWVHLDIAGTAYSQADLGWIPKGPTGTPVGTFVEILRGRVGR